ncbi:hypothetical protein ACH42_10050 [Endozoicomonas sp. (ex Bugula neritina AB1)]|nr:hypothetical protein ACH42_10050 [Endozoicomonas sp. (ex Bugula neritina AB1)]
MADEMYTLYSREYEEAIADNVYNAHLERPSMLSMLPDLKGQRVLDYLPSNHSLPRRLFSCIQRRPPHAEK